VAARDQSGAALWTALTDATGAIPPQTVVTETRTGASPGRRSGPLTVTAKKPGFAPHEETLTATGGGARQITLRPE
jgi:hypothetical protein